MTKKYLLGPLVLLCFAVQIASCAHSTATKSLTVNLQMPDPLRIRFSGKGAGAGMMLSSSMGPMGIAIGVAIDEGIAKSIHAAFEDSGGSLSLLAAGQLSQVSGEEVTVVNTLPNATGAGGSANNAMPSQCLVEFHKIGFKTTSEDGDLATPEVDASFNCPSHFKSSSVAGFTIPENSAPLSDLKTDGQLVAALLSRCLNKAFELHRAKR